VLGFIDGNIRDYEKEASNVVNFGLDMVNIIKEVSLKIDYTGLKMRIGIHTGNVYGGIIGKDIVRYDIYGKDVAISNKMESEGLVDNVAVSE